MSLDSRPWCLDPQVGMGAARPSLAPTGTFGRSQISALAGGLSSHLRHQNPHGRTVPAAGLWCFVGVAVGAATGNDISGHIKRRQFTTFFLRALRTSWKGDKG